MNATLYLKNSFGALMPTMYVHRTMIVCIYAMIESPDSRKIVGMVIITQAA
jgi:hypothetical protein